MSRFPVLAHREQEHEADGEREAHQHAGQHGRHLLVVGRGQLGQLLQRTGLDVLQAQALARHEGVDLWRAVSGVV